ncbi:MAG: hypothetical protein EA339_02550 [Rhodobacteraceae bacterium]|nr:MAG: hypothetical protein EA339_02550 [Paracoccaceae bacterium]
MRFLTSTLGRCAAVALALALAPPADAIDGPEDLPEGEGRDEAFYACIACHSMQVVTRQGMTRGMWQDTLTLMVERHGMMELEPDEHELILSYLSEHFPAARATGRGWTNPFD